MPHNAAHEIRDDLIAQDVRYRRVDAQVQREVDARFTQMEQDLRELMQRIDVHGAKRKDARQRRLEKLDKESKVLISTAYTEINGIIRAALRRIAKVEAQSTAQIVRKHVP